MSGKRCIDGISEALDFCIILMDNGLYTTIHIGYHMQGNDLPVSIIVTDRRIRRRWYLSSDGEVLGVRRTGMKLDLIPVTEKINESEVLSWTIL